jgi:membrane glycosyltransferase
MAKGRRGVKVCLTIFQIITLVILGSIAFMMYDICLDNGINYFIMVAVLISIGLEFCSVGMVFISGIFYFIQKRKEGKK